MKSTLWLLGSLILLLGAYLSLWPVAIDPVAWQPPAAPGYTGVHASNTKLASLPKIALDDEVGPEHIVAGADGKLYAGMASGNIVRFNADGSAQQIFSNTGGRPLGLAFAADGQLIVADAIKGLLSVALDGAVGVLATKVQGAPILFPNAVVVARNGKIYFTDSSMRFAPAQWGGTLGAATLDIFEQSSTGRVLEYSPENKMVRIVARGLSLANGITLSADETALFVSESGKYRVWRIATSGNALDVSRPSPQAQVLLDNLPGYPDNLTRGINGKIWLGLGGPRNDLDAMAHMPFMRRLMLRIPRVLWPTPKPYGHVFAFTEDGKVLVDLQDPSGNSPVTTGITEAGGRMYLHSIDGVHL